MMYAMGRKVFPVDTHVGRVMTRLGPYRELGLSLDGLDHKQLQKVLDDLIPADLQALRFAYQSGRTTAEKYVGSQKPR